MKRSWLISLIVIITLLLMTLPVNAASPGDPPGLEKAIAAQEKHNSELLGKDGVVGTAVGLDNGNPVIQVLTERGGVAGIPATIEGIPVRVLVTGKITAIGPAAKGPKGNGFSTTDILPLPVPIGVSTGNIGECSAGTIGARVKDTSGNVYALSNNHVYALENDALPNSTILQPGRYDTNCNSDANNVIGTLYSFVKIDFNGSNRVDAAIAVSTTDKVGNATPNGGYGTPSSTTRTASLMMSVQKYGRTSKLTKGTIIGINVTVNVGYSSGVATFTGQILVYSSKPFIKAGDSGSLLVTSTGNNPIGLLFAGNSSGSYAFANQIDDVLTALGVTIDGN